MRKGITLIEVVVVLAVYSIILSVAMVSFSFAERQRLSQAAQEIKLELQMLRYLSLFYNMRHDIWFLEDRDRLILGIDFRIVRHQVCFQSGRPQSPTIRTGNIPHGIVVYNLSTPHAGQRFLGYTSRGTSTHAGTITLASQNYFVHLTVTVGSGVVSIGSIERRHT